MLDSHEATICDAEIGNDVDGQLALPRSSRKTAGFRQAPCLDNSEESRAEVHRMRHASDALLTGIGRFWTMIHCLPIAAVSRAANSSARRPRFEAAALAKIRM